MTKNNEALENLHLDEEAKKILIAKRHVKAVLTPEFIVNMLREYFDKSEHLSFISERSRQFISLEKPEFRLLVNLSSVDESNIIESVNELVYSEIFDPFSEAFRHLIQERNILSDDVYQKIFKFAKDEIENIEDDVIAQLFMIVVKSDLSTNSVVLDDNNNIQVHVYYLW